MSAVGHGRERRWEGGRGAGRAATALGGEEADGGEGRGAGRSAWADVAKMASHVIFQYNVSVIDIDNTILELI